MMTVGTQHNHAFSADAKNARLKRDVENITLNSTSLKVTILTAKLFLLSVRKHTDIEFTFAGC
jgi:hypothetical protein